MRRPDANAATASARTDHCRCHGSQSLLAAFFSLGAEMRDLQRQRLRPAKDGHRRRGGRGRKKQGN